VLKHTRVTTAPDVTRIGKATAQPGNDPRTWVSFATVDAVGVDAEGVFVDVTLQPSGEKVTARLGTMYAGPGFGFHIPIGVDDEVVVGEPSGDPLHGAVVLARLHSASDELPQAARDNADDLVLVVKDGRALRIGVSGGGKAYLGAVDADDAVQLKSDGDDFMVALAAAITALTTSSDPAVSALSALQGFLQSLPPATVRAGRSWPVAAETVVAK
jgi:hypothetical protein